MSVSVSSPTIAPRERVFSWVVGLLAVPVAMLMLVGPTLFDRPFWSDEILSWLIASDPSFHHGMAALAGGVDTNAPLLHLMYRGVGNLFGHTPLVYRTTASLWMGVALVGLYFTLRRTFERRASIAGCLAFSCLPLVLTHTTEARFYALLLAGTTWTAYGLAARRDAPGLCNAVGIALSSIVLCGAHYFGLLALACLMLGEIVRSLRQRSLPEMADQLYPALAGVAMTACSVPLLLAQRTAMRSVGGTWVPDEFVANLNTVVQTVLPMAWAYATLLIAAVVIIAAGRKRVVESLGKHGGALAGLLAYAGCLLAFDRLVQPVLVPRYFVVMLPGLAWAMTALLAAAPRRVVSIACAAFMMLFVGQLLEFRTRIQQPSPHTAMSILHSLRDVRDGPIVSDWLGHALPVWMTRAELRHHIAYLPDLRLKNDAMAQAIPYEREMAACVQRFYGMPAPITLDQLRGLDRFVLISEFPETVGERFPEWERRVLGDATFEMTRDSSSARTDR